jgi:hypothetical protein
MDDPFADPKSAQGGRERTIQSILNVHYEQAHRCFQKRIVRPQMKGFEKSTRLWNPQSIGMIRKSILQHLTHEGILNGEENRDMHAQGNCRKPLSRDANQSIDNMLYKSAD